MIFHLLVIYHTPKVLEISKICATITTQTMSHEVGSTNGTRVSEQIATSKKVRNLRGQATLKFIDATSRIIVWGEERIRRQFETTYDPDYDEGVKAAVARGDRLVVVSNHPTYPEPLLLIEGLDHTREISGIEAWDLLFIKVIMTGDKGAGIKGLVKVVKEPVLDKHKVNPLLIVRSQDKGILPSSDLQVAGCVTDSFSQNHGIVMHATGTVDEGRRFKEDPYKGLIRGFEHFQRNALRAVILENDILNQELGTDNGISFIVATDNWKRYIHNPDTMRPTVTAFLVGTGLVHDSLASAHFSRPIRHDQGELGEMLRSGRMSHEDWERYNAVFENEVIKHLPADKIFVELPTSPDRS
jgi:hypothetical protein